AQSTAELQTRFEALQTLAFYTNDKAAVKALRNTLDLLLQKKEYKPLNFKKYPSKSIEALPDVMDGIGKMGRMEWKIDSALHALVKKEAPLPAGPFLL